jgi:hypothetical protein
MASSSQLPRLATRCVIVSMPTRSIAQADLDRRDPKVVHRAILEARVARLRHRHLALHGRDDNGAAAEPRSL